MTSKIEWDADGALKTKEPPPDLPEDYLDWVSDDDLAEGGCVIVDELKIRYWVPIVPLVEVRRMDTKFESDDDFYDWFRTFRSTHGIKPEAGRTWWRAPKEEKKSYLSDWWSGSWFSGYGGSKSWHSGTEGRRLATALQAVQTTVRVIDDHDQRFRVVFTQSDGGLPSSFTSFDERLISISPSAMLDEALVPGEAIDITTGYALHEGSHAQHTLDIVPVLTNPTPLRPASVAGNLLNILEDVRIERLTIQRFPGFEGYLTKVYDYLWPFVEKFAPMTWGPELKDKLNAIIGAIKWPERSAVRWDAALAEEMPWWQDLLARYLKAMDNKTRRGLLEEALARLREDGTTALEMDKMAEEEIRTEAAYGDLERAIRAFIEKLSKEVMAGCPSHSGLSTIPAERTGLHATTSAEIAETVATEMEVIDPKGHFPVHSHKPMVVVMRPPETAATKSLWKAPDPALVRRMRTAFHFRPRAEEWETRLLKEGDIDEDELWRGGTGDPRIFQQRNIESRPNTSITLLVDASGSMRGSAPGGGAAKYKKAVEISQIMHEVLRDMTGVRVRVRAHTGDGSPVSDQEALILRVWESGEPPSRLAIPLQWNMYNNYDGYAIGWCVEEILGDTEPDEQRVIIVLADGIPSANGYGGEEALKHVGEVTAWAERKGVHVIQVAIDEIDSWEQDMMFKHWLPFRGMDELPKQILSILQKLFR